MKVKGNVTIAVYGQEEKVIRIDVADVGDQHTIFWLDLDYLKTLGSLLVSGETIELKDHDIYTYKKSYEARVGEGKKYHKMYVEVKNIPPFEEKYIGKVQAKLEGLKWLQLNNWQVPKDAPDWYKVEYNREKEEYYIMLDTEPKGE